MEIEEGFQLCTAALPRRSLEIKLPFESIRIIQQMPLSHFEAGCCSLPFSADPHFFAELQRASGLRVLRRVIERKRSIELSEAAELTSRRSPEDADISIHRLRKKPPAKLKPLTVEDA